MAGYRYTDGEDFGCFVQVVTVCLVALVFLGAAAVRILGKILEVVGP